MSFVIPIVRPSEDASHFTLQIDLDGTTYTLEFVWNMRAPRTDLLGNTLTGAWFLNVLDITGSQAYMVGMPVTVNYSMARNITQRTPRGLISAIDTTNSGLDPDFDDLGNRVKICYTTAAELGL